MNGGQSSGAQMKRRANHRCADEEVRKRLLRKAAVGRAAVRQPSVGKAVVRKPSVGKAAVCKPSVGKAAVRNSTGKQINCHRFLYVTNISFNLNINFYELHRKE